MEVRDLNGPAASIEATLSTQGGDLETVSLFETQNDKVYLGSFPIGASNEAIVPGDGFLQGSLEDEIAFGYLDDNDGSGTPAEVSHVASLDCQAPIISSLSILTLGSNRAVLGFSAHEPARAFVYHGTSCSDLSRTAESSSFSNSHRIELIDLVPSTQYFYTIGAVDFAGNHETTFNADHCFTFVTHGYPRLPFHDDFESGEIEFPWGITGVNDYRTQVTSSYDSHSGSYCLLMDDSVPEGSRSRNEATLVLDLEGFRNIVLSFWAKGYGDESDGPPATPFLRGADFDGVAISEDGLTWYEIQPLRPLGENFLDYVVDLDAAVARYGLQYSPDFRIRFNQFDEHSVPSDGIAIDDVSVIGNLDLRPKGLRLMEEVVSRWYTDLLPIGSRFDSDELLDRLRQMKGRNR
jgi:hypothetical protein